MLYVIAATISSFLIVLFYYFLYEKRSDGLVVILLLVQAMISASIYPASQYNENKKPTTCEFLQKQVDIYAKMRNSGVTYDSAKYLIDVAHPVPTKTKYRVSWLVNFIYKNEKSNAETIKEFVKATCGE